MSDLPEGDPPVEGTIDDMMDWVCSDPERARAAIDAERANKNRSTLIARLEAIASQEDAVSETQQQQEQEQPVDEPVRDEPAGDDRYGGDEPLPYPEHEPLDTITYRDPRPLDWPQVADRNVFIGVVHKADPDPDADDPQGDYVYANQITDDPSEPGEIELSGTAVEHAQVIGGGRRLTLILDGQAYDLTALGAGLQADLQKALQVNANS